MYGARYHYHYSLMAMHYTQPELLDHKLRSEDPIIFTRISLAIFGYVKKTYKNILGVAHA